MITQQEGTKIGTNKVLRMYQVDTVNIKHRFTVHAKNLTEAASTARYHCHKIGAKYIGVKLLNENA